MTKKKPRAKARPKKTTRKRTPLNPVVRMLNTIEAFLLKNNSGSRRLWNILSALRGPDNLGGSKAMTTIPIRRAAFPRLITNHSSLPASFGSGFSGDYPATLEQMVVSDSAEHFHQHIRVARQALIAIGRNKV